MAPHRPFRLQPQAPIAYLAPGERFDGRGFGQGYSPRLQTDQVGAQNYRDRFAGGVAPLSEVIDDLDAKSLPVQLLQASFLVKIPDFGAVNAQLLIPKNPLRRFSFLISNFTGANLMMFSYDRPFPIDGGLGAGVPVGGCFEEPQGVSVNDLYVFCNDPDETYPIFVLGYEGGISNIGNRT